MFSTILATLVLALVPTAAVQPHAVQPAHSASKPNYLVAYPRGPVMLYSSPRGRIIGQADRLDEFGQPKAWAVVKQEGRWLAILDPAGNNRPVWVRASKQLGYRHIRISLSISLKHRTLTVFRARRAIYRMPVGVGAAGTPTPLGHFGVTDHLPGGRFSPTYGCCILALSGHQTHTPASWPGGDRLAIHGTDAPSTIGQAASYGCLRGDSTNLRFLMHRVPIGTQVFIRP